MNDVMRPSLTPCEIESFRTRLVRAAKEIFAKKGAEGVTMREIALETGVSAMTPYRYFKDKNALMAAVRTDAFDRFSERLEAARARKGRAGRKGRAVGEAYLAFALEDSAAYRLIFDLDQNDVESFPDLQRAHRRARATMVDYMSDLVAEGRVTGDAEVLGQVYWAAVHGLVTLYLAGKLGDEAALRAAYEVMIKTLAYGAKSAKARQ